MWAAQRVLDEDPVEDGFNTDWESHIMQDVLGTVVDAAGVRWGVPMSDGRYALEAAKKTYGLPHALLRVTGEALRNDSKTDPGMGLECWNIIHAIRVAYARGDLNSLTKGMTTQGRDAPAKWAANYLGTQGVYPRKLEAGDRKDMLVETFTSKYCGAPKRLTKVDRFHGDGCGDVRECGQRAW